MGEWPLPLVPDHLRADDDVAEGARHPLRNRVAAVDREREDVGHLVDRQMLALQRAHLLFVDERNPELAVVHAFGAEHPARQLHRRRLVDLDAASVVDLDGDHRPRSSVCSLYASTIRWTSLW